MKPSRCMDKDPYQICKAINHLLFGTDTCAYLLRAPFYTNLINKMSVLKVSKTSVFLLRMSGEYLTKYRQGSAFHGKSASAALTGTRYNRSE